MIGDAGLIATADHVVLGASELWVVGAGPDRERAEIVCRAPELDLALIRVDGPVRARSMSLPQPAPLRPGQCVIALGNVMNWGIGIFQGMITLTWCQDRAAAAVDRILTDITTPPGLSGGALVDCATFGIVALSSRKETAGIIGAVPAVFVKQLLSKRMACGSKPPHC